MSKAPARTESIQDTADRDVLRERTDLIVSLACLWEATARKVGNVHPNSSFPSTSHRDFATSAVTIARAFERPLRSVGEIVYRAVEDTRLVVGQNTNLGMVLLLAPLAKVPDGYHALSYPHFGCEYQLENSIGEVLGATTVDDADSVFTAIRNANPGGLGRVPHHDVREPATITLLEAMKRASDRDLIARQYANQFCDVFRIGVPALLEGFQQYRCLEAAIIHCHLTWMAQFPDSLIVRKNDEASGEAVRRWAEDVLICGGLATPEGRAAGVAFDAHLRSDGNKLNPGTTADLVCACLFVALREGKLKLSDPFPWKVEDWL